MNRIGWGILIVAGATAVGCGGSSNSASPFTNTTLDSKDAANPPKASAASKTVPSSIPVFLTTDPASLTADVWAKIYRVELQTSTAQVPIYEAESGLGLRLGALRDVNGSRYLYLGRLSTGSKLVRAQIEVGSGYLERVASDVNPKSRQWGSKVDPSTKDRLSLALNLDPNAAFQDAMVLQLNLTSKDGQLVPELKLGSASQALEPGRQDPLLIPGQVRGATWPALSLKTSTGMLVAAMPSKDHMHGWSTKVKPGASAVALMTTDPSGKLANISELWITDAKDSIATGVPNKIDSEPDKSTFEPDTMLGSAVPWPTPTLDFTKLAGGLKDLTGRRVALQLAPDRSTVLALSELLTAPKVTKTTPATPTAKTKPVEKDEPEN